MKTFLDIVNDSLNEFCLNINYTMFLIDRKYTEQVELKILRTKVLIKVREIKFIMYDFSKYVFVNFYLSSRIKNLKKTLTHFMKDVHVINELKVKMFINMNILKLKKIDVLVNKRQIIIINCNDFTTFLTIVFKE